MKITKESVESCMNNFIELGEELLKDKKLLTGYNYDAKQLVENFSKVINPMKWLAQRHLNKKNEPEVKANVAPFVTIELKKSESYTPDETDVEMIESETDLIKSAIDDMEELLKGCDGKKKVAKAESDPQESESSDESATEDGKKKKKKKDNKGSEESKPEETQKSFTFGNTIRSNERRRELQDKYGIY